ncbi:MAG: CRISPR-associated endonuclease Cas2 [Bacteroidota bacterium]
MRVWIMYDISSNKLRHKIAKSCKQMGLKRVQKSVFYGQTKHSLLQRFQTASLALLSDKKDSILILPVTKKGMKKLSPLSKKRQWKAFKNKRNTRFL